MLIANTILLILFIATTIVDIALYLQVRRYQRAAATVLSDLLSDAHPDPVIGRYLHLHLSEYNKRVSKVL